MRSLAQRAAVFAACAAVTASLAPLSAAGASTDTGGFEEARASIMAAGFRSMENASYEGYSLVATLDANAEDELPKEDMRIDAWASWDGDAAIRYRDSNPALFSIPVHQGSYTRWQSSTPVSRAWNQVYPNSRQDEKVMRQLPEGTRFTTGAVPTGPQWNLVGFGVTAERITATLSQNGYLPWDIASIVALCGEDNPPVKFECTGGVETISGKQRVWNFEIVRTISGENETNPDIIDVTAYSDVQGNIVEVEYVDNTRGFLTRMNTQAVIGAVGIPSPARGLNKGNSVSSSRLTEVAAATQVRDTARLFRMLVKESLASAGKPLSPKNALWAYNKFANSGISFAETNQWTQGLGTASGLTGFTFSVDASDGITKTTRYANVVVKKGRFQTVFTDTYPEEQSAEMTSMDLAPSAARVETALPLMPWAVADN